MSCIFCRILDDEIPSYKVYEDDHTLAFLDKNPVEDGHTLLIPREHTQYIEDLSPRSAGALMNSLVEIVPAIQRAMDTSDSNIAINNGSNAGQIIPHVHIHIIPRPTKNGKRLFSPPQRTKERKKEYYEEIAEKIRNKLVT
jgi:histidine triad (HIT) family protein